MRPDALDREGLGGGRLCGHDQRRHVPVLRIGTAQAQDRSHQDLHTLPLHVASLRQLRHGQAASRERPPRTIRMAVRCCGLVPGPLYEHGSRRRHPDHIAATGPPVCHSTKAARMGARIGVTIGVWDLLHALVSDVGAGAGEAGSAMPRVPAPCRELVQRHTDVRTTGVTALVSRRINAVCRRSHLRPGAPARAGARRTSRGARAAAGEPAPRRVGARRRRRRARARTHRSARMARGTPDSGRCDRRHQHGGACRRRLRHGPVGGRGPRHGGRHRLGPGVSRRSRVRAEVFSATRTRFHYP